MSMRAAIDKVFAPEVRRDIAGRLHVLGEQARKRFDILTAHGPKPSDVDAASTLRFRRARRAAWEAYLDAAEACGILNEEMMGNLRQFRDEGFRSAMSEAMTAWVILAKLKRPVLPKPAGNGSRQLDMAIKADADELLVEVKAPYARDLNERRNESLVVEKVREASKQFPAGRCNVLVVAPDFRFPLYGRRLSLVRALIGQPVYVVPVALSDEVEVEPPYESFKLSGRLTRRQHVGDGEFGKAQHTRVSAVVTIEEELCERPRHACDFATVEVKPRTLVVHNPFAAHPMPEEVFAPFPQLVRRGDVMFWTDQVSEPGP